MNEYEVNESSTITENMTGKRWRAVLIKAGWGSKAYYTEEALRRDGSKVFTAGTPIFLDHQTAEEREHKPFGSVQNFAGELATDAYWDAEEGGLVAEVEFFDNHLSTVKALAKRIGLSVRAQTRADRGTVDGRAGRIVTELVGARSVDLVVRAGAGGQLLDVLESESEIEMEEHMSQEILDAIANLGADVNAKFEAVDKRFAEIEESLTAEVAEVETVVETEAVAEQPDIAKLITEAIAAEFAARPELAVVQESATEEVGDVEDVEVEESATRTEVVIPRYWATKENK